MALFESLYKFINRKMTSIVSTLRVVEHLTNIFASRTSINIKN